MPFLDILSQPIDETLKKPLVPVLKPLPIPKVPLFDALAKPVASVVPKLAIASLPSLSKPPVIKQTPLEAISQPIKTVIPHFDVHSEPSYSGPSDSEKIKNFAKTGYDTIKRVTLKDVSENAARATAEFTQTGFESIANFVSHLSNLSRELGGGSRLQRTPGKIPSLTKDPIPDLSHESYTKGDTIGGVSPASLAGTIVGGSAPYIAGGSVLGPAYEALEKSGPLVRILGKAFLNAGLPALIHAVEPLKKGETQKSRFLETLPSDVAFGVTSIIPDNITSSLATGLSQFGIGKAKGQEDASNILNSALLTIFGLVSHTPVKETALAPFESNLGQITERMKAVLNADLGPNPHPVDVMTKAMAQEFVQSSPNDQKSFVENITNLVNMVVDKYKETPGKQGGYVKNPVAENKPEILGELAPLAKEASKYKTAEEAYEGVQKIIDTEIDKEIAKGTPAEEAINTPAINKLYDLRNEFARQDLQSLKDTLSSNIPAPEKIKENILKHDLGFLENSSLGDIWDHVQSKVKNFLDPENAEKVKTDIVSQLLKERGLEEAVFGNASGLTEKGQIALRDELASKAEEIYDSVKTAVLEQKSKPLTDSYNQVVEEGQSVPSPTEPSLFDTPSPEGETAARIGQGSGEKPRTVFSSAVRAVVRRANAGDESALKKLNEMVPETSPLHAKIFDKNGELKPLDETQAQIEAQGQKELQEAEQKEELQAIKDDKELFELKTEKDILEQVQTDDVAGRELSKFVSDQTGRLPEVTGKQTMKSLTGSGKTVVNSLFGSKGDTLIQSILGAGDTYAKSPDTDTAQKVVDDYLARKKRLSTLKKEISARSTLVRENAKLKENQIKASKQKPEKSNEDVPQEIKDLVEARAKALRQRVADRLAREQADAVVAFYDQNPDVLDNPENIDEAMSTFVDEWIENNKANTENEVNEETAEAIEKERGNDKQRALDKIVDKYAEEGYEVDRKILEANHGIVPPKARGGIRSPQFVVSELKDIAAIRLSNETMERNIEIVAKGNPTLAKKLNAFLVDPTRKNEVLLVEFKNELRNEIRKKMVSLGIKRKSKESFAARYFAEGKMPIDQLMREFPKNWEKIQEAANYGRDKFDALIDIWNAARAPFGYKPVPKRANYIRHGIEMGEWFGDFGFLKSGNNLPTEIAGLTEDFSPGKQFTTAEMKRTGDNSNLDLIGALDDWLESVSPQIFHIDSIQRGRALEKYIRAVAKVAKKKNDGWGDPVDLPNFVSNLNEHTNFLAGKQARIDRGVELYFGRKWLKGIGAMKQRFGANAVGGNLSTALSNLYVTPLNLATVGKSAFTRGMLSTLATPLQGNYTYVDGVKSDFLTRRYPEKFILPRFVENASEKASIPFDLVDRFSARNAVASKYYEGRNAGLSKEEAMKRADDYAVRLVGDRSRGNTPNLQNSKTIGLWTQFSFEANNNIQFLLHDIPGYSKENIPKGTKATDYIEVTGKNGQKKYVPRPKNWAKIASTFVQFIVFAHLTAWLIRKMRGNTGGLDPLSIGLDLAGFNDDDIPFFPKKNEGKNTFKGNAEKAIENLANQIPYANVVAGGGRAAFTSVLPDLINVWDAIFKANYKTIVDETILKPGAGFLPPFGGSQAKKTLSGLYSYFRGYTETGSGKKAFDIEKTVPNFVRSAAFGKYATKEGQEYTKKLNNGGSSTSSSNDKVNSILQKYGIEDDPAGSQIDAILQKYGIE